MVRIRRIRVYRRYPNGYQLNATRRTLQKIRGLGIFNRLSGERQLASRRNAMRYTNKLAFDPIYNYPGNNRRTLSISLRPFAKQVADLRRSNYFISQHMGSIQNMYGSITPKKTLNWNSDVNTLALQARNIMRKENEELSKPAEEYLSNKIRPRQNAGNTTSRQTQTVSTQVQKETDSA